MPPKKRCCLSVVRSMVAPSNSRGRARAARALSVEDDAPDRLAGMHQIEALVDLLERHGVRDQIVDVDLLLHVPVDDLGHVRPAPRPAERSALPDAAGHELERPGGDLLAGAGDADDDALAPAA